MMLPMASSKKNVKGEDQGSQEERGTWKEEEEKKKHQMWKEEEKISKTMQQTLIVWSFEDKLDFENLPT